MASYNKTTTSQEIATDIIKKTRKKFILFTLLGMSLVILVSLFSLNLHNKFLSKQKSIHALHETLAKQIFLIFEIADYGEKFNKMHSATNKQQIKDGLNALVKKLKLENENFKAVLDNDNTSFSEDLEDLMAENELKSKIREYLKKASELTDQSPESSKVLKNRINFLSMNSKDGLYDIFTLMNKRIRKHNRDSTNMIDRMGTLLITLCFLEILLVWLLVFRPLYSAIQIQHRELTSAMQTVERANQTKSEFLANISHEIRTPMTGILGYAEVLQNDEDISSYDKNRSIDIINNNAHHLLELVDEILDFSKIESGKMKIRKKEFSFIRVLGEVYSLMLIKAKNKNLNFSINNTGPVPTNIISDKKRLKQILHNIVGNAIKFTSHGEVKVTVNYDPSNSKLLIDVIDTGCGIDDQSVKKIFNPFEQANNSVSRNFGGTGLGLVLSKKLAIGLGGDITLVKTKINEGSRFRIEILNELPTENQKFLQKISNDELENLTKTTEAPPLTDALNDTSILIVDDAKENARLFGMYLKKAGAIVDVVNTGDDAIALSQVNTYDIILLDLQMPDKDGFQVLSELRRLKFAEPVIALTAHAMESEKIKTKAAGFNGHVTKPVTAEKLINVILNYL